MLLGVWDGLMPEATAALSSSTKVGGQPVYTYPLPDTIKAEIDSKLTRCEACGDQMFLVLQSFSPLPNGNEDFNRMKYVYACNSTECSNKTEKATWRSFSVTFSSYDEAAENAEEEDEELEAPTAYPETLPPYTFPVGALDFIDEPAEKATVLSNHEERVLAVYERRVLAQKRVEAAIAKGEDPDTDDEAEAKKLVGDEDVKELEREIDLKNNAVDVAFDAFRLRVGRAPQQVLRYQPGSKPLYMNPSKMSSASVSPCPRCSGPQVVEFQLMPTLLYLLRVSQYTTGKAGNEGMDFATVTIMRCKDDNCGCADLAALFDPSANKENGRIIEGCEGKALVCMLEVDSVLVESAPTMDDEHGAPGVDTRPTLRDVFQGNNDTPPAVDETVENDAVTNDAAAPQE